MFEAYSIGVRISLINHASAGLTALSRAFIKTEGDAAKLEARIKGIKSGLLTGGLLVGAGVGLATMFEPAIKSAVRYENQMNRLRALIPDVAKRAALINGADSIASSVKGMSRTDALRLFTETQGITGNVQHTLDMAPMLAKMRFGIETYEAAHGKGSGQGEVAEAQFNAVTKSAEMRGLMRNFSRQQTNDMLDLFTKSFVASGGQVKPADYLAMLKTAGVAGKSVNPDFMLALGHMMQESGGSRTGSALMSGYQNLVAGRTTQQVAELLQSLHMLNPGSIKYGKTGHITKIMPGALVDSQMLQDNPLDYLNKVILPKMAAKGVDINNMKQVLPMLNQMFSNRRASALFSQMYMDRTQLANYMGQAKGAMGVDALYDQSKKSTQGNIIDLTAKFDSLLTNLGEATLPLVNKALDLLIPAVKGLADWMLKHKTATKILAGAFLGLAAAMAISGTVLILTSGFRALSLVMTFASLGGAGGIIKTAVAIRSFGAALMFSQVGGPGGIMGITRSLTSVVGVIGLIGQAAAVVGAAYGGYKVGQWLEDKEGAGERYGMGNMWARGLAALGSDTAKEAIRLNEAQDARDAKVRPGGGGSVVHVTNVNLDGRHMTRVVTHHQTRAAYAPQTGTSRFDATQGPMPIGANGY